MKDRGQHVTKHRVQLRMTVFDTCQNSDAFLVSFFSEVLTTTGSPESLDSFHGTYRRGALVPHRRHDIGQLDQVSAGLDVYQFFPIPAIARIGDIHKPVNVQYSVCHYARQPLRHFWRQVIVLRYVFCLQGFVPHCFLRRNLHIFS